MARFRGKVCDPVAIKIEFLKKGNILDIGRKGSQLRRNKAQTEGNKQHGKVGQFPRKLTSHLLRSSRVAFSSLHLLIFFFISF